MELLYVKEHLTCYNYDGGGRPAVESVGLRAGESRAIDVVECEILIVLDGSIGVSFEKIDNGTMTKGDMVLLPPCSRVVVAAEGAADILVFRLRTDARLCDRYSLENLYEEIGQDVSEFEGRLNCIKANKRVDNFIAQFLTCIKEGLKCIYFFEIKIKELFFMLRAYYPKKELAAFFAPMLSADYAFLLFVFRNYDKVRSVKELAELADYSLSGFDKQFRKVFGMSAYQWIKQKRLKNIYHAINCSPRTLREICDENGFLSLSQFNDFCKKNFGMPPGKIRRKMDCPAKMQ